MTTETPRVALFQRLNEVLGPDHASTLMTYLPTDEPATKSDFHDLKSEISGLKSDLKSAILELRTEVKSEVRDLKSDISELRTEVRSDLREMEQRLSVRMDGIDTRLNNHDQRFDNVHEAMRQQTRTFILATTGTMVTLSALAFGAAALI
jgi:chromosome segregation ATPase